MPLPTYAKTGVTTLTWSKGESFPYTHIRRPRQVVGVSESGAVRVSTLSVPEHFILVTFVRVPLADYNAAIAFFEDALIDWKANTWTYTNSSSEAFTVRLWDDNLESPEVVDQLYTLRNLLRIEIP